MQYEISKNAFIEVCNSLKKRVVRVLYLKEDLENKVISVYDVESYVSTLSSDFYGAYVIFNNTKFINCMIELEGIKQNFNGIFIRKKILDLANYVANIPNG